MSDSVRLRPKKETIVGKVDRKNAIFFLPSASPGIPRTRRGTILVRAGCRCRSGVLGTLVPLQLRNSGQRPPAASAAVHQRLHSNELKNSFVVVEQTRGRERAKRSFDAHS